MNVRLDINSNPSTANVDISEKIAKTRSNGGLKQTETHQCDNAGHWEFTWATFTKFENGETVWERHCGTGSDVNMDRESGVRAQLAADKHGHRIQNNQRQQLSKQKS